MYTANIIVLITEGTERTVSSWNAWERAMDELVKETRKAPEGTVVELRQVQRSF